MVSGQPPYVLFLCVSRLDPTTPCSSLYSPSHAVLTNRSTLVSLNLAQKPAVLFMSLLPVLCRSMRTCRPAAPSLEQACNRTAPRCATLLHEVAFHSSFLECRHLSFHFAAVAPTLTMKREKSGP